MPGPRTGRTRSLAGVLALALVAVVFTPAPASSATAATVRVSVASDGSQADGKSVMDGMSGDGRFVAFSSEAANLVPGDTNNIEDVFVRDRQSSATTRVSVSSNGTPWSSGRGPGSARPTDPTISADGRYVAFAAWGSNLVSGDTNGAHDVFVHDRQTGTTTRVSVASDGTQGDDDSRMPSLSADGRYVAFSSNASNLVVGDTNLTTRLGDGWDVFVHDRLTGATTLVSRTSEGAQGAGRSTEPAISGDGRYVAFVSGATLSPEPGAPTADDVYVHDRLTATTTLASKASDGTADRFSRGPAISGDGRFVAFWSFADNFVPDDTNEASDVFVLDRQSATMTRVSVAGDGAQASGANPRISADGRYVSFVSDAPNLAPGDTNAKLDVFVHDRQTALTRIASAAGAFTPANADSGLEGAVSDDGGTVAFGSAATNLVAGDTNGVDDVFVHRPQLPAVSVGDVALQEGDAVTRTAVFTLSLSEPSAAAVTVTYATADAGASSPGDYTARSGAVSFAPGVTHATVKVPVVGDALDEAHEAFALVLSDATGAVVGDGTGTGTVVDDDPRTATGVRLAVGDVSVHEGDAGARAAVFTVSLSKASTSTVKVSYATANDTAAKTADYTRVFGTLSFAPGVTSLTVKVPVVAETLAEDDETFALNLSAASGATVTDANGLGTIVDGD